MAKMTVSAALRRVKKIKGLIAERDSRLKESAVSVEGKEPAFAFSVTMEERSKLVEEMIRVQTAIAVSNARTQVVDARREANVSVAYAIRRLEEMKSEMKMLRDFQFRAKGRETVVEESREWDESVTKQITVRKTTVWVSAMTQVDRATMVDKISNEFDVLNNAVEVSNHQTVIDVEG